MLAKVTHSSLDAHRRGSGRALIFGFAAVIVLLVAVTVAGLLRLMYLNVSLETAINEQNLQVDLITRMRNAARERSVLLQSMVVTGDVFERDARMMELQAQAAEFLYAESLLRQTSLDPTEQEMLDELKKQVAKVYALQRRVIEQLNQEQLAQAIHLLMDEAIPAQESALSMMDSFFHLQQIHNRGAWEHNAREFRLALYVISVMGVFAIFASLLVARTVRHRIAAMVNELHHYGLQIRRVNEELVEEIRARTRVETELRDSERRERAIRENILDPIITLDERGTIQSINKAGAELFGYSSDELNGRNVTVLMPESYQGAQGDQLASYLRMGRAKIAVRPSRLTARHKNGSMLPVEVRFTEVDLDGERIFVGVLRAIKVDTPVSPAP